MFTILLLVYGSQMKICFQERFLLKPESSIDLRNSIYVSLIACNVIVSFWFDCDSNLFDDVKHIDNNRFEKNIPTDLGRLSQLTELIVGKQVELMSIFVCVFFAFAFFSLYTKVLTVSCGLSLLPISSVSDNNMLTGPLPSTLGKLVKLNYLTFCKYNAPIQTLSFFCPC